MSLLCVSSGIVDVFSIYFSIIVVTRTYCVVTCGGVLVPWYVTPVEGSIWPCYRLAKPLDANKRRIRFFKSRFCLSHDLIFNYDTDFTLRYSTSVAMSNLIFNTIQEGVQDDDSSEGAHSAQQNHQCRRTMVSILTFSHYQC